jgi:hypothetical protein
MYGLIICSSVYMMINFIEFLTLKINPVEIGNIYTEPVDDNPFTIETPDTVIVIDKKDGYVKYMRIHSDDVGNKTYYDGSCKELNFKLYWKEKE